MASATGPIGAAVAPGHGHAPRAATPTARDGFAVVQYAVTNPLPLPWSAHLLSGTNPSHSTASGPHAAPDADGGTQVAYRNPAGDVLWLDGAAVAQFSSLDLTRLTGIAPLQSEPVPAVSPQGLDQVFCVTASSHLLVLTWDPYRRLPSRLGGPSNRLDDWTRTDLTQLGGPLVSGTPSVVVQGGVTYVFTRTASGDLVEYASDGKRGRTWNAYDLTLESGGPKLATDPAALYDPATQQVRVAATEVGPHRGDVVVFTPNDVGGRIWSVTDVTSATHTSPMSSGLSTAVYGGQPVLFGADPTGELTELVGTDTVNATTWATTDLTATTAGAPEIAGTPSATVSGNRLVVAAVASGWGDLFEWSATSPTGSFTASDVSSTGTGPTRTVAGTPAAVFVQGQLTLFAAGVSVPAPEGTGVYSIPYAKWAQAIKDGWPILGDTGGLGAQCAPWTTFPSPSGVQADETVGDVIQASHQRETWLSFWTVSGPGTAPSSSCTKEKAPYSTRTYYLHGYDAGAWVAAQIDAYRGDGLALKPDWVLFDPEGYPNNHSGLWGPTKPASKLALSVAHWFAILNGWRKGLAAVDPTLKAGLYANQYEYMAYELYNQPLPTFVAGAFAQKVVAGKSQLVPPVRIAFGPNIRGFVMYNSFNPTCTQLTNERLLLQQAPWFGDYNTIQTTPGKYCPPGGPT